jgi:hypothetical protein
MSQRVIVAEQHTIYYKKNVGKQNKCENPQDFPLGNSFLISLLNNLYWRVGIFLRF